MKSAWSYPFQAKSLKAAAVTEKGLHFERSSFICIPPLFLCRPLHWNRQPHRFFSRRTNWTFLSGALGFSSGVMIYVSFVEIFSKVRDKLAEDYTLAEATWITVLSFFDGMVAMAIIDRLASSYDTPTNQEDSKKWVICRTRNSCGWGNSPPLPWKSTTFRKVSLHSSPPSRTSREGISVSIYYATGSRRKALLSFLSGVAEPVGELIGYLVLKPYFSVTVFGVSSASNDCQQYRKKVCSFGYGQEKREQGLMVCHQPTSPKTFRDHEFDFVLAMATLYLVSQEVVKQGKRRFVDPPCLRGSSYLKIGCKWIKLAINRGYEIITKVHLSSEPDPEPAIASKKQLYAQSRFEFDVQVCA